MAPDPDRWCPDCLSDDCKCPCDTCGGEGWIEDQTDPVNTDFDPEAGGYDWPLEPCPTCNPEGANV